MKIIFHGGAQEVGKSCIEIQSKGKKYLLDAGVKFTSYGNEYPKALDDIFHVDAVFLSHAHMDHSGALPMLEHKQLNCPIYMTELTWRTTNSLLQDSYHLEQLKHIHPAYAQRDLGKVGNDVKFIQYDKEYKTPDGNVRFQFINAGHIPGSASILMELEGKNLLYTGDINTEETLLMIPSIADKLQDIDILITENTYGERPHPDRSNSEECLIKSIHTCLDGGGSALIPVFSVGRSQEILILLQKLDNEIPIYLDGMPRKLTEKYLQSNDPYIKNKEILSNMFKRAYKIKNPKERDVIAKKRGIVIVSSSGMLQGGPVMSYAEHMIHNKDDFVLLTGFQAMGTNGRHLFEDHTFRSHHQTVNAKAHIRKFDFSAHYGKDSIHSLAKRINPKHLILQHGDLDALEASKHFAEEELKSTKTYMPAIGDVIEIN